VVNCLNFGNPEHPEVMWQLSESIDGMAEACGALALPVIGGNVSLYNESGGADIDPTPVLGVLGLVDEVHAPPPGTAWAEGDAVVLLGARAARGDSFPLEGTRWATERRDHRAGSVPRVDFAAHRAACGLVAGLVAAQVAGSGDGLVRGVHDVSGGGLAVAAAEMAARSSWPPRDRTSWSLAPPRWGSPPRCSGTPEGIAWCWATWWTSRWRPSVRPTRAT
jgi:phosphoribosylformylglycinamidine synthase